MHLRRPRAAISGESPVALAFLASGLRRLGYDVDAIGVDPERLRALREIAPIDLVVVDLRMPDALATVRRVRALVPTANLLVLAALAEVAEVRAARLAGADGAIRRPPLGSRLVEALAPRADATRPPTRDP